MVKYLLSICMVLMMASVAWGDGMQMEKGKTYTMEIPYDTSQPLRILDSEGRIHLFEPVVVMVCDGPHWPQCPKKRPMLEWQHVGVEE